VTISKSLSHDDQVAMGHALCASILTAQCRYVEANARYDSALTSAQGTGDKDLEATLLRGQGDLADRLGQLYGRA
jgi:hypothetical protein